MAKNATIYRPSFNVHGLVIENATENEAKILRMILTNEARKLNPKIDIEVYI
ncbi:hypothetical protein FGF1_03580 [Flavobacteriaceae bacterium GF1]